MIDGSTRKSDPQHCVKLLFKDCDNKVILFLRNPEQSIEQCAPELMIQEDVIVIKEEPVQESDYDDPENPLELPEHVSGEDEGKTHFIKFSEKLSPALLPILQAII